MKFSLTTRTGLAFLLSIFFVVNACMAHAGVDDYPDVAPGYWKSSAINAKVDTWGHFNRQCTSFVSFRLSSRNGFEMPWHSDAENWGTLVSPEILTSTPAVGAVAWWSSGHVAWVEAVNGSDVTIEEYNVPANSGLYNRRTISASNPTGYIHFKDMNTVVRISSPAIAMMSNGVYGTAFQANNVELYSYFVSGGAANLSLGTDSTSSPAIAAGPNGSFRIAMQSNLAGGNKLYTYDSVSGQSNTDQGMMTGTNPSICRLSTGIYKIAFQANNGKLYVYDSTNGPTNLTYNMKPGTSPCIVATTNGNYIVAFQGSDSNLYSYDSATGMPCPYNLGMMAGTSPSIAISSTGGLLMSFTANNGHLYVYDGSQCDLQLGVFGGTSPSIAAKPNGGYYIAFQGAQGAGQNCGHLYIYDSASGQCDLQLGMRGGTSPSIAVNSSGGYRIAFQCYSTTNSTLYTYDSTTGQLNTGYGM